MNEDSFLDSFMESYIGGWTGDEDAYYASDEVDDSYYEWSGEDDVDGEDEDDWVEPMDLGDLLNHNQRHLDEKS